MILQWGRHCVRCFEDVTTHCTFRMWPAHWTDEVSPHFRSAWFGDIPFNWVESGGCGKVFHQIEIMSAEKRLTHLQEWLAYETIRVVLECLTCGLSCVSLRRGSRQRPRHFIRFIRTKSLQLIWRFRETRSFICKFNYNRSDMPFPTCEYMIELTMQHESVWCTKLYFYLFFMKIFFIYNCSLCCFTRFLLSLTHISRWHSRNTTFNCNKTNVC